MKQTTGPQDPSVCVSFVRSPSPRRAHAVRSSGEDTDIEEVGGRVGVEVAVGLSHLAHAPSSEEDTFTAYQTFRFCCPGLGVVNFPGFENIPITRTISQNAQGCWEYTITKPPNESLSYELPDQDPPCTRPGLINYGKD
jgi:hypothetical protein